jgi:flagellar biosynthesis anti-sigma factor FlgM
MVSEINSATSNNAAAVAALEARVLKSDAQPTLSAPAVPSSKEGIDLTNLASQLRELTQSVADQPVVDKQLVEGFQKAVNDGSYRIDPPAIADKLAGFEALLTTGPSQR